MVEGHYFRFSEFIISNGIDPILPPIRVIIVSVTEQEWTLVIILAAFGFLTWLVVPQFMIRDAIRRVIEIFRARQALDIVSALTPKELGLGPRPFFSFRLLRDWKPDALKVMKKAGLVVSTPDGRLYLSERRLREIELLGMRTTS